MIDNHASMGAVNLKVADLQKMTAFYRDVIGLQVLKNSAETTTLGTSIRTLVRLRHNTNGRFGHRHSGLFHLALRVPNRQALATWLRHYISMDAQGWQGASDHGVSEALYLNDPEGNGIEVYRDRPRTQWPVADDGRLALKSSGLDVKALMQEAASGGFSSIDPGTVMGHVHLRVSDVTAAHQFYVDSLGFELQMQAGDSALFVAAGGYHHHLGLNNWQSKGGADNSAEFYGLDQFELCFDSAESRQHTVDRLIEHNHTVYQSDNALTVCDPFNNTIVLTIFDKLGAKGKKKILAGIEPIPL